MKVEVQGPRLSGRRVRLWHEDYLVYRYLWPNLVQTVHAALRSVAKISPKVLDVGCGNKPYRDLFGDAWYIGLNYSRANATPDVIGDALALPFADASFDLVFATQVLEHLPEPATFLKEAFRVLNPGGVLILSCPFYWPLHEEPYDFFRFTKYGLAHMLRSANFEDPVILADGGGWAQAFLALGLQLPYRLRAFRILTNLAGASLDRWFRNEGSTANYTLHAKKRA